MKKPTLLSAILIFIAWTVLTLYGTQLFSGEKNISLDKLISTHLSVAIILAAALLTGFVFFYKLSKNTGLQGGFSLKDKIFIYPITVITLGFILSYLKGLNVASLGFGLVIINTFFVGISEEMMFRGIILTSLAKRMSFWKSVLIMSLLFGSVHVLNVFITGNLSNSILQAFIATFSGFLFLGIRLKTNSILPAMFIHWLCDLMVFSYSGTLLTHAARINMKVDFGIFILAASPFIFGTIGIIQCRNKETQVRFMASQQDEYSGLN